MKVVLLSGLLSVSFALIGAAMERCGVESYPAYALMGFAFGCLPTFIRIEDQ
jgi:hypothetical protein